MEKALLELAIDVVRAPADGVRVRIDAIRLYPGGGVPIAVPTGPRRIVAPDAQVEPQILILTAPAGSFVGLELDVVSTPIEGPAVDARLKATLPFELDPRAPLRLRLEIDVERLHDGGEGALRAELAPTKQEPAPVVSPSGARSFQFDVSTALGPSRRVGVVASVGSLSKDARIALTPRRRDELPPLFRGQRMVGPVVQLVASEEPKGWMEITIPYDDQAVIAAGFAPADLVILQLDEARTRYRELRPGRVDTAARRLTARVDGFSFYVAGTPAIRIDLPQFHRNGFDEAVAYSASDLVTLSGQVSDERATISCAEAPGGWSSRGWFAFESIPHPSAGDMTLHLRAEVEGLLPHDVALIVRRRPASRCVAEVSRLHGTGVATTSARSQVTSSVVHHRHDREQSLLFFLREWQRGFTRSMPCVFFHEGRSGDWRRVNLLPELHFENVAAAAAIRSINEQARGPGIPLDQNHPEPIRELLSIHDYLEATQGTHDLGPWVLPALNWAAGRFGAGNVSVSYSLPIHSLSDDTVEVAFVAATHAATELAAASSLRPIMVDYYAPRFDMAIAPRPEVHAGTIYYARASRDGTVEREAVAQGIWCARVAFVHEPLQGRPVLLALGVEPDSGGQPRSSLLLFERQPDGSWSRTVVSSAAPFLDADVAYAPSGDPIVVACSAHTLELEPQLHELRKLTATSGFLDSPINWRQDGQREAADLGILPRIVFDSQGRQGVSFVRPYVADYPFDPQDNDHGWMMAVWDERAYRAVNIGVLSEASLTGDINKRVTMRAGRFLPPHNPFVGGAIGQSGRAVASFAPALAADGDGRVYMAYGDGALVLEEIDLGTITATRRVVDVDRRTGFAPSLALRDRHVPIVAYKDDFGSGSMERAAQDDLHFFNADTGVFVPDAPSGDQVPPTYIFPSTSYEGFAPYRPLTCERFLTPDDIGVLFRGGDIDELIERKDPDSTIDSILLHRRFNVELLEGGPRIEAREVNFQFWFSHRALNDMIHRLATRPRITQFTIDNGEHPEEDIARLDLTVFDPLAVVDDDHDFRATLDGLQFPTLLRERLRGLGFTISGTRDLQVQRIVGGEGEDEPGNRWTVTDPDPFAERVLLFPQPEANQNVRAPVAVVYNVRRLDDGRLEFTIAPLLTVTDRDRFRDADGKWAPCQVSQIWWDMLGRELAQRLVAAVPNVADDIRPARRVRVEGARITSMQPATFPGHQQNSVVFTLVAPYIWASGIDRDHFDAEFTAHTTEPTTFLMSFAPFVNSSGLIDFWAHNIVARLGHLDVTVGSWGDLDFLRVVAVVMPILAPIIGPIGAAGPIALVVGDIVVNDIADDEANQRVDPPDVEQFSNTLMDRLRAYVRARFGDFATGNEAVYLRGFEIQLWHRTALEEHVPSTNVSIVPESGINFGFARVDAEPAPRRTLLFMNNGDLPVLVEAVAFAQPTDEFRFAEPIDVPRVLRSGDAMVLRVEVDPHLPQGDRINRVRVRIAGGTEVFAEVRAIVVPPPRPLARLEPALLNFGIVVPGQRQQRTARLANDGDGDLVVSGATIEAEPNAVGLFTVAVPPARLAPTIAGELTVTYAPLAGAAMPHRGVLRVTTNDADHPVREIDLFGQVASGALVVDPAVTFLPSVLLPALPFGVGSTRSFNIYNTGTVAITLLASSFRIVDAGGAPSAHFLLSDQGIVVTPTGIAPPPPIQEIDRVLPAGSTLTLTVMFRPTATGPNTARVIVTASDPAIPSMTVQVSGEGL